MFHLLHLSVPSMFIAVHVHFVNVTIAVVFVPTSLLVRWQIRAREVGLLEAAETVPTSRVRDDTTTLES